MVLLLTLLLAFAGASLQRGLHLARVSVVRQTVQSEAGKRSATSAVSSVAQEARRGKFSA